ncbi:MAG TPA: hypothetical protein VEV65_02525 [Kineosporiaceae bacterium]|jgi:hypothetical protein|nr:hypothetical protein [Kineosporiaceae bacterium]
MEYTRQELVELLHRAGLPEVADAAARELPDPVDLERLQTWALRRGISRDQLLSRLGGSP